MISKSFEKDYADALRAVDTTNPAAHAALMHLHNGHYREAEDNIRDLPQEARLIAYRAGFFIAAMNAYQAAARAERAEDPEAFQRKRDREIEDTLEVNDF